MHQTAIALLAQAGGSTVWMFPPLPEATNGSTPASQAALTAAAEAS